MDYLTLVKRLASETGTELESKITSVAVPPATSYGESTEHRTRLIKWVQEAWIDIQEDQDQWNFMIRRVRVDIARNQISYEIGALVDAVEGETIYDNLMPFVAYHDYRYIWLVDGGQSPPTRNKCYFIPPEKFFGDRDRYSDVAHGLPAAYSIERDGCLVLNANPASDNYYLEFEYKMLPQTLLADGDIPRDIKEKHHMLIVYYAMKFYAGFDETAVQWKRASRLYKDKMNKLRLNELRDYSVAGTRT